MPEPDGGRAAPEVANSLARSLESGALADAPGPVAAATAWVNANVRDIVMVLPRERWPVAGKRSLLHQPRRALARDGK